MLFFGQISHVWEPFWKLNIWASLGSVDVIGYEMFLMYYQGPKL